MYISIMISAITSVENNIQSVFKAFVFYFLSKIKFSLERTQNNFSFLIFRLDFRSTFGEIILEDTTRNKALEALIRTHSVHSKSDIIF